MRPSQPRASAAGRTEYAGGTPAPADGTYSLLNVLGRPTGSEVTLRRGEKLPQVPRGFVWVLSTPSQS